MHKGGNNSRTAKLKEKHKEEQLEKQEQKEKKGKKNGSGSSRTAATAREQFALVLDIHVRSCPSSPLCTHTDTHPH